MTSLICALTAGAFCAIAPLNADTTTTLRGKAQVYDGDTLYVNSQAVRLWGIDAEELDEPNGLRAKFWLRNIIQAREVVCTRLGNSHNRITARCAIAGVPGSDLGSELVKAGLALDCPRFSGGAYNKNEPPGARIRLRAKPYCR